jgi:hypothetical protein
MTPDDGPLARNQMPGPGITLLLRQHGLRQMQQCPLQS